MAKRCVCLYLVLKVFFAMLASQAWAFTNPVDVTALQDLYRSLNQPPELTGWKLDGGDPCVELWTGVSCFESSILYLDVSSNKIEGEIPYENMADNYLGQNIPHSLPTLKNLRYLDLSHNNFTGDLPSSFGSLTSLTRLFLQDNKFTGSVTYLAELPLTDLFHVGDNTLPWDFPLETVPIMQNISAPPKTHSSAIENHRSPKESERKKKPISRGGIAFMLGGGTLMATCVALVIVIRNRSCAQKLKRLGSGNSSLQSIPVTTARVSTARGESPQILDLSSPPVHGQRQIPPVYHTRTEKKSRRRSFSMQGRLPARTKLYTLAELQSATNSFSEENLLGEGSLGSVFRAEFPDGQILAVKNINMVSLSFKEEEQFMDVIWTASRLRHPNIVTLLGYSTEHGQHLLVYEYVRNLSLDDALHSDAYKPLSWGLRLRIALGVARALDYLHSTLSPPVAHSNLKAANILLDEELMPRVCDCGLAILRPLTSNRVKIKASEIALFDTGYLAHEHGESGIDNTKTDIYAFGVLLLELLTGRKPFENSRPREEQSLVKWASSRLHDNESLEEMVDPAIKRSASSKTLSRLADIISLCIQPVKQFRPPMSEIVESLTSLLEKFSMAKGGTADGNEEEEKSFRSTNTRFLGSPELSHSSP
ncbi:hypothetical protein I3760_10G027700 [Carya illinoinensis]|nr:hypothetical protein I3760_10G027700 [Carya illinoinensis]